MRTLAVVALLTWGSAVANGADLSVGVLTGAQLLETQSDGGSHGRLIEKVVLSRTALGGLFADVGFGRRHHLAIEAAADAFSKDARTACIYSFYTPECSPTSADSTRYAVFYGVHYSVILNGRQPRTLAGVGIGVKRYSFTSRDAASRPTLHAMLGVEFGARVPVRLEVRPIAILGHPYLRDAPDGSTRAEIEVRASIRVALRR